MAATSPARSHTASAARHAVEWSVAPEPVLYPDAVEAMEERVAAILARQAPEQVWLLEHPPLYTAGTSARADDLLDPWASRSIARAAEASTPTTAPVSGWPTSCSTLARAGAWTCVASSATSNNG